MQCNFCLGREQDRLSVEHLVSRPVAEAFGIDRRAEMASVDGTTLTIEASRPLTALGARLACRRCNNGWMGDLENEMRLVARWINGRTNGISPSTLRSLRRWLLKTHMVLSFIEGGTRRFGSSDDFDIIPQVSHGRRLYEGDDGVFESVAFGFARRATPVSNAFGYLVETPLILHNNGVELNRRGASVSTLDLGLLRTFCVVPFLDGAEITMPSGCADLRPGTTFKRLPRVERVGPTNAIAVDYGEKDIHALLAAVSAAADEADS